MQELVTPYNTTLVAKGDVPAGWKDLLDPKGARRLLRFQEELKKFEPLAAKMGIRK